MLEEFPKFADMVHARYLEMAKNELYVVDIEDIFSTYLAAFPEGTNPIFRERTEHDCSCCKQFIRTLGALVTIHNGNVSSVWDCVGLPYPYDVVAGQMSAALRQLPIRTVFRTKERQYGTKYNYDTETSRRWDHFHGRVEDKHYSLNADTVRGEMMSAKDVMKRGLEELHPVALATVHDLIASNSFYRGAEHKPALDGFITLQRKYLEADSKELFILENMNDRAARFRNTVIGTLVVDLSEGVELETAVRKFEAKVAPANYKRTTSLITPRMIDDAVNKLKEMGLEGAVERRFARIEDVSVNNVLFVDNAARSKMRDGLTSLLMSAAKPATVSIDYKEKVSVEDFLSTIVPKASSLELLLENKHLSNFVSLTAPAKEDTGQLFRWGNDFAWSYDGEVTDSIKQRVKAAGGNVDAALRVSLAWFNTDDLDLHVRTPYGQHIYYGNKGNPSTGNLDVDMNVGHTVRNAVENVSWTYPPRDGNYVVQVNNFTKRESVDVGFMIEVQSNGQIQQFSHKPGLPAKSTVDVLTITVRKGVIESIKTHGSLVGGSVPTDKWGVQTETLVPVDTLMLSPNYWDGQHVGNQHLFFILKGCKNPEPVRGIYNEFLKSELEPHRKVFEVLGGKLKCEPTDDQLSGVGFSSTKRDAVTVVVKGESINKAFEVTF